jgi:hypothetical protein
VIVLGLVGDEILLDGEVIAMVVPNLRLSQRDRLTEALDALDEDGAYIAELEARIAEREALLAPRGASRNG